MLQGKTEASLYSGDYHSCGDKTYCYIGFVLFILYFISFFIVNSSFFLIEYKLDFRFIQYVIVSFTALLSLRYVFRYSSVFLLFTLLSFVYLFSGLFYYFAMTLAVGGAVVIFSRYLFCNTESAGQFIFISILVFIFVLMLNYVYDQGGFFNTKFGRSRMDLGFNHPKQLGSFLLAVYLIFFYRNRPYGVSAINALLFVVLVVLLYLVGSRSSMVALVSFVLFYSRVRLYVLFLAFFSSLIVLIMLAFPFFYMAIDRYSSYRLTRWLEYTPQNIDLTNAGDFDYRFGADSIYIELYSLNPIMLAHLIFLLALLTFYFYNKKSWFGFSSILALSVLSLVETGVSSAGNILHIVLWMLIVSELILIKDHCRLYNSRVCVH